MPRQVLEPDYLCGAGPSPLRCTSLIQVVTHNLELLGRWHMQLVSGIFQGLFYLLYYILIYNYIPCIPLLGSRHPCQNLTVLLAKRKPADSQSSWSKIISQRDSFPTSSSYISCSPCNSLPMDLRTKENSPQTNPLAPQQ